MAKSKRLDLRTTKAHRILHLVAHDIAGAVADAHRHGPRAFRRFHQLGAKARRSIRVEEVLVPGPLLATSYLSHAKFKRCLLPCYPFSSAETEAF